jgi:hypothetical protein
MVIGFYIFITVTNQQSGLEFIVTLLWGFLTLGAYLYNMEFIAGKLLTREK